MCDTTEQFSGGLLPVHLKPQPDELLSSWLMRLAMAHGQKLHTFCSHVLPNKAIWNRDIDKSADAGIMQVLSDRTGTPLARVRETGLAAYEGVLYEQHNHFGPASWIMPVGVYHRTRQQFGLQYCPHCLTEDQEPYYRRRWRLAFMVVCERHGATLRDRCPCCLSPVNFHRNELGDFRKAVAVSLTHCHCCNFDLRQASACDGEAAPVATAEINFVSTLLRAMVDGCVKVGEIVVPYPHLYFEVLRQLLKIMAMRHKRVAELRRVIGEAYSVEVYTPARVRVRPDVQELAVRERRQLLGAARCLLDEWPHRFIALTAQCKLWSSVWLRHLEPNANRQLRIAPFWFWSVVHNHLYRASYHPSAREIEAAVKYLLRRDGRLTNSALSRLLGIAFVRRGYSSITAL